MARTNPTKQNYRSLDRTPNWHDTGELPDGTPVGKLGALWYVLNDEGDPISDGWHEITPLGGDRYRGKVGARTETFVATEMVTVNREDLQDVLSYVATRAVADQVHDEIDEAAQRLEEEAFDR